MFEIGVLVAVIVALGQLFKNSGVSARFIPIINVVLGVLGGLFFLDVSSIQDSIIYGLMIGLGASGLFDVSKVVTKKNK